MTTEPQKKQPSKLPVITGAVLAVLSGLSLMVLYLLNALFPEMMLNTASPDYAEGDPVYRVGMQVFLEVHDLEWLYLLSVLGCTAGIILCIYGWIRIVRAGREDSPSASTAEKP